LLDQTITLRPITLIDQPFLTMLYASTRVAEMALLPWNEAQKSAFLQMQLAAQTASYQQRFAQAMFSVICFAAEPVGRLSVDRAVDAIHLIEIALLPAYRNRGIGAHLLRDLLAEGASRQAPVRLQVAVDNPAQRLYTRLGFVAVGTSGVYQAMEWQPPQRSTRSLPNA